MMLIVDYASKYSVWTNSLESKMKNYMLQHFILLCNIIFSEVVGLDISICSTDLCEDMSPLVAILLGCPFITDIFQKESYIYISVCVCLMNSISYFNEIEHKFSLSFLKIIYLNSITFYTAVHIILLSQHTFFRSCCAGYIHFLL